MRKVILLMHTSLDGFVAGPNGEMDWIKFDDKLWEYVGKITDDADTAIYGRITYGMMEPYWPTAGDKPGASSHDIQHSKWYNESMKIVFSSSLDKPGNKNTRFIKDNMKEEIEALKKKPGKNLLLIGSVSIAHAFMKHDLIDECHLTVNPVLLGAGTPLFKGVAKKVNLRLLGDTQFECGVAALHYSVDRK